jgi:hypothetical protein
MKTDSTAAKIGRSMKNREITAVPLESVGQAFPPDGRAR